MNLKLLPLLVTLGLAVSVAPAKETIRIAIGTQDTTINCATGWPLVRELKLLEKFLPRDGKYKDVVFDVQWES
jgi:NitT/TauT family transport system substrate-binding protein